MAKKPKWRKYKTKFSVKTTKLLTVFGLILGMISVMTVLALLYMTFSRGGEATLSYAFAGALTSVFSLVGLILSIFCLSDHYQTHMVGWCGFLLNGAALLAMAGILYLGMM